MTEPKRWTAYETDAVTPVGVVAAADFDRLRDERDVLRAALSACVDEAVETHESPSPLMSYRDTLRHRLSTAGHLYGVQGFRETLAERDEARRVAGVLADAARHLLDPDGSYSEKIAARHGLRSALAVFDTLTEEKT